MDKKELVKKLERQIFWIDISRKRMERVYHSGAFNIALLEDITETCDNLKDAQKELTEILTSLKVESSSQKEETQEQEETLIK